MIATLAKSSYGWSPLWLHFPWTIANLVKSSYGWSPLWLNLLTDDRHFWLNLPTDDRHFGYISYGRSPLWLNLPTDDRHFGYISYGRSPIWLNLPTDDRHFGYISHGGSPIWLNLPTDDRHFGYIIQLTKNTLLFFFIKTILKKYLRRVVLGKRERERGEGRREREKVREVVIVVWALLLAEEFAFVASFFLSIAVSFQPLLGTLWCSVLQPRSSSSGGRYPLRIWYSGSI